MKRILSVVGARPNFMKVAPIHHAVERLVSATIDHSIVHTGQHYDASMSDAFFADLRMPQPAYFLGVGSGSHAQQTAAVMTGFDAVLDQARPDYVIVVGDVNSTVACALVAVKRGIRTAHVEAGLRSFDRAMPEEINRLATDAICDDLFVTEPSGKQNLLHEGVDPRRIHHVGNTMIDSLHAALPRAMASTVLQQLGLASGGYVLATLHRPSNVDDNEQLAMLAGVLSTMAQRMPVVFPVHPRTRKRLEQDGLLDRLRAGVHLVPPMGYVDFLALMRSAALVVTDSGGIQEETTALGVACITARTTTERPVTVDLGTNVLVPPTADALVAAFDDVLAGRRRTGRVPELWDGRAAERIVRTVADLIGEAGSSAAAGA